MHCSGNRGDMSCDSTFNFNLQLSMYGHIKSAETHFICLSSQASFHHFNVICPFSAHPERYLGQHLLNSSNLIPIQFPIRSKTELLGLSGASCLAIPDLHNTALHVLYPGYTRIRQPINAGILPYCIFFVNNCLHG